MPGSLTAKKRNRQNKKRRIRNRTVKSKIKTAIRTLTDKLSSGNVEEAAKQLRSTISTIDEAAGEKILHRNTARRKISQLTTQLNKMAAVQKKTE